ncbi:MAG: sulfatase-like hydrolase/transferase [Kiritimatiellales bacterium]|nr:sulfatase-like hydrolase/transferase [Kiritimatiellales bacterium]
MKKTGLLVLLLPVFAMAGLNVAPNLNNGEAAGSARPNIVLILIDDVGTGWIPPYAERLRPEDVEPDVLHLYEQERTGGRPLDVQKHIDAARTCMPQLAALAKEGAVFDRCFATASLCGPSRAGLLTGTFQQRWGAYWNLDVYYHGVPTNRVVMAEPLHAAGYRTGMIGKWHIATRDLAILDQYWADQGNTGPIPEAEAKALVNNKTVKYDYAYESSSTPGQHPLDRGFDYYFGYNSHDDTYYNSKTLWEDRHRVPQRPKGELLTDLFNEKSCEFITSALEEKKPFFLYYAPMTLHGGIQPPPQHYSDAFDTGVPFSNIYAGHLLALDDGIEKIFQTLKKYGQDTNTLFILSADNGCTEYGVPPYNAPYRGGKGTGWLGGMHVPFVVWQPGVVKPGINQEITSLADVMPTVLEAAGAEIPDGIDGLSLMPLLRGETLHGPRTELYSSGIHASHWSYFYEGQGEVVQTDGPQCPMYAWKIKDDKLLLCITPTSPGIYMSLPNGLPSRTMFYDLSADPRQLNDIGGQYPEQVKAFGKDIQTWLGGMKPPLFSQQTEYRTLLTGQDQAVVGRSTEAEVVYQDDFSGAAVLEARRATEPERATPTFMDAGSHVGLDGQGHLIATAAEQNGNYRFRVEAAPLTARSLSAIECTAVFKVPANDWIGIGFSRQNRNGLSVPVADAGPWIEYGAGGGVVIHGGNALAGSSTTLAGGYAPGDVVTAEMTYFPGDQTLSLAINGKMVATAVPVSHVNEEGIVAPPVAGWVQIQFKNQPADGAYVDSLRIKTIP